MALNSIQHALDEAGIVTEDWFSPKVYDAVFNSNPTWSIAAQRARQISGGEKLVAPQIYAKAAGGFHDEWATFGAAYKEQIGAARWSWKLYQVPVAFSELDLLVNADSPQRRFNLTEHKNFIAARTAADDFGISLFDTSAAGFQGGLGTESLDKAISDNAEGAGKHATYGEITRAASGDTAVWNSNVQSAVGPISPGKMQKSFGDATESNEMPNWAVTTQLVYNDIHAFMTPIQRLQAEQITGRMGFRGLIFNETPIVVDSHVAAGYLYWLNWNYIELIAHRLAFFTFRRYAMPAYQLVHIGRYHFAGNSVCYAPRFQAKMIGITTS